MFRFYLHNGNQYYYLNALGNVDRALLKREISTPDGWDQTSIEWNRNMVYWGVFRSFTNPYEFVEDGAKILRKLYYEGDEPLSPFGSEAQCTLTIEKQNPNTGVWEFYYSGSIDFSQFHDSAFKVTVNVMESGLNAYLEAYADTNYNFPLQPGSGVKMHLDGIALKAKYKYVPVWFSHGALGTWRQTINVSKSFGFSSKEGSYSPAAYRDVADDGKKDYNLSGNLILPPPPSIGGFMGDWHWQRYYLEATSDQPILIEKISVSERVQIHMGSGGASITDAWFRVRMIVADASRTVKASEIVWQYNGYLPKGEIVNTKIQFQKTGVQLNKGDRIFIFYEFSPTDPNDFFDIKQFTIEENPDTKVPFYTDFDIAFRLNPTDAYGERIGSLFNKICASMSENTGASYSSFLSNPSIEVYNNKPYNTIATSGDSLRNLTSPQTPAIRTSFSEFFQAMKSIYGVGFGIINNVYRLEQLSFFLNKNSIIADLGEVSNLEVKPATEVMFNSLKIGYGDYNYDEVNGLDEYNTGHEYKLPIKTIARKEDRISNYRADAFGIEAYRANLTDKKSVDAEQDNETFLIEVDSTQTNGAFNIRRQNGFISGVLYPNTRYNYGLSPKRNFWRIGGFLRSVCRGLGSREITYQTSKKNNKLVSSFAPFPMPPQIAEAANVPANTLPDALFTPILFTFTCVPPDNIASLMATNPIGCFIFTYNGVQFKGFPMKVGTKPATWESYEMTLLATPDTDITQLIY